jgi:tetratricopeptide (TPR) repeat protein
MPDPLERFRTTCFVIMPFGKKPVGRKKVDFDKIYSELFEPAIARVALPADEGGGHLKAVRTDKEFHSGVITQEMFELIEYSRFAVGDITGLNANVFYELGFRHRARAAGTAIFRQQDAPIPFDISQVKAAPYAYAPEAKKAEARDLIARVLAESLVRNAWDSPIWLALRQQHGQPEELQRVLREAEDKLRELSQPAAMGDGRDALVKTIHEQASALYERAIALDPGNPLHHLRVSYHLKALGRWDDVISHLQQALGRVAALMKTTNSSTVPYAEIHRELGIAINKRDRELVANAGELELRRAIQFDGADFDALSSLGGILKRVGDAQLKQGDAPGALQQRKAALDSYERAAAVSHGHPYPVLNAFKLRAALEGRVDLNGQKPALLQAQGFRRAQVSNVPPMDEPWSFFDLAEIQLYLADEGSTSTLAEGLRRCTAKWMPSTFLSSLSLLPPDSVPGLDSFQARIRARISELA